MAKDDKSSIPIVRASHTIRSAPGLLGFSALVNPDTKFNEDGDFAARIHFTEAQQAVMADLVESKVIEPLFADLEKLAGKKLKRTTGAKYLEDKLQPPREGSKIELPSIQLKCAASFVSKRGETAGERIQKTLKAWDNAGTLLDLGKLRTGMGSTIQLVFTPGLYTGPLTKGYAEPTLRLEGIIVLKNVPWGVGQGGNSGDAMSEAELQALMGGEDIDTDLAQFAGAKASWAPGDPEDTPAKAVVPEDNYDLNDDIPF
jgi:hypothetical protein